MPKTSFMACWMPAVLPLTFFMLRAICKNISCGFIVSSCFMLMPNLLNASTSISRVKLLVSWLVAWSAFTAILRYIFIMASNSIPVCVALYSISCKNLVSTPKIFPRSRIRVPQSTVSPINRLSIYAPPAASPIMPAGPSAAFMRAPKPFTADCARFMVR